MDDDFMKQFSGSASANVVTVILVGFLLVLKTLVSKKCKHSKCHSLCLDLEIDTNGENEKSEESDIENSKSDRSTQKSESSVHRLHRQHDKDVHKQHPETV